uniref:Uncharacterized protein n=1 Tax=Arundo donax TaxID=35708 RepID=A0A0A9HRH2_ARUDO
MLTPSTYSSTAPAARKASTPPCVGLARCSAGDVHRRV